MKKQLSAPERLTTQDRHHIQRLSIELHRVQSQQTLIHEPLFPELAPSSDGGKTYICCTGRQDPAYQTLLATMRAHPERNYHPIIVDFGCKEFEFTAEYAAVREEMASIVSKEGRRPTVITCYYTGCSEHEAYRTWNSQNIEDENILSVVGGVGTRADADLMRLIYEFFQSVCSPEKALLVNMSCPVSAFDYLNRIVALLNKGTRLFGVASNTAYVHEGTINAVARFCKSELFHLPRAVAEYINMALEQEPETKNKEIRIFGTTQAWFFGLYDGIFNRMGINYKKCNLFDQAGEVQAFIKKVKAGGEHIKREDHERLYEFLCKVIEETGTDFIIFSCTELHQLAPDLMEKLKEKVTIFDTQPLFAMMLARKLNERVKIVYKEHEFDPAHVQKALKRTSTTYAMHRARIKDQLSRRVTASFRRPEAADEEDKVPPSPGSDSDSGSEPLVHSFDAERDLGLPSVSSVLRQFMSDGDQGDDVRAFAGEDNSASVLNMRRVVQLATEAEKQKAKRQETKED